MKTSKKQNKAIQKQDISGTKQGEKEERETSNLHGSIGKLAVSLSNRIAALVRRAP